jgi:hypothetical protein
MYSKKYFTEKAKSHYLTFLLAFALFLSLYSISRYGGWAMDVDGSRLTISARVLQQKGELINEASYQAGFVYPFLVAAVSEITGVSIQAIQLNSSLWTIVIGLAAFACFQELLNHKLTAALATLLLLIQPDFMFYIFRSSHEKITWLMALLLILQLSKTYRSRGNNRTLLLNIGIFYFLFWGMVSTNAYFASTFLIAIAGAFLLYVFLTISQSRGRKPMRQLLRPSQRFFIISMACFILVYVFINYAYSPALGYYNTFVEMNEKTSALFLGAETVDPYSTTQTDWRHPYTFLSLSATEGLITILAAASWVLIYLKMRDKTTKATDPKYKLLWLLSAGFGIQMVLAIILDLAGFMSSNLQIRLFTPFILLTSPLAALLIHDNYQKQVKSGKRLVQSILIMIAIWGIVTMLLKATNDPLVSNNWGFYSPSELQGVRWVEQELTQQTIWLDTSSHLGNAYSFWDKRLFGYYKETSNNFVYGIGQYSTTYLFISYLTRMQANRLGVSLPATNGLNVIYDNGEVQLYRRLPRTPYQR